MIAINAKKFRAMRRQMGFPQTTIAKWFGVTVGTVNRWENDKTGIDPSAKILLWLLYDEQVNGNKFAVRDYIANCRA